MRLKGKKGEKSFRDVKGKRGRTAFDPGRQREGQNELGGKRGGRGGYNTSFTHPARKKSYQRTVDFIGKTIRKDCKERFRLGILKQQ